MLSRALISLLALGWLSGLASGQNLIREWTGASGYRIFETTVWIDAPGTYKFQATDPNGPNGLGVIDHILLDANCPEGTVNVYVLRDPNEGGGYGAKGVGEINLKKTGVETNIMDVLTTVNLAYLDMIQADTISGDIGTPDIGNDITVDYLGAPTSCATICTPWKSCTAPAARSRPASPSPATGAMRARI